MKKYFCIFLITSSLAICNESIYDSSWALIIGINKYDNVRNLNYAVDDAESMKNILVNTYDFSLENIILLKNNNATRQNILQAFSDITKQAKKNDRVLIFFAGHGETEELPDGGEMGYLLPVDGKRDDLYITAIGMEEFKKMAHRSRAKHVLYLVDACYGGLAAIGSRSLDIKTPNYLDKITKDKARQIITAGGRGEKAIEKPEWGHSAFTLNLIRGLENGRADMNANGFITANELGLFLSEKVTLDSESQQTPQYGRYTSHEGEFVFINKTDDTENVLSLSPSTHFEQTSRGLETYIPQAFKSGTIKMDYRTTQSLDDIVAYLKKNPYKSILIESHTNNDLPTGIYSIVYTDNWKLSLARADEISNYLLFQGINPEKLTALGYADHWPFGIPWEDVHFGKITESMILSLNKSANIRAKNRRINIVISNTESEYDESNQSIHFCQDLYNRIEQNISSKAKNVTYKLIISKFDEDYTMTFSFPPIVGPNTGQLIASIPHFIMQAPSENDKVERWENKIVELEQRLSDWEVNAPMGDSLTTFWGSLSEYYFRFYVQ